MVLARLDEQVALDGRVYALTTNEWASGAVTPGGYTLLESLHLEGSVPVFTYALADALLQKRNWMAYGANTTYVTYCLVRACRPARLTLTPIGGFRDYHSHNIGAEERPAVQLAENGARVTYADRTPLLAKDKPRHVPPGADLVLGLLPPCRGLSRLRHQWRPFLAWPFLRRVGARRPINFRRLAAQEAAVDG